MSPRPWPRLGGVFSRLEIHLQYRRDFFSCLITPHWLKLNNKIYEGRGEKVRKGNVSYIVNSHLRSPSLSHWIFRAASCISRFRSTVAAFRGIFHVASFLTLRDRWSLRRTLCRYVMEYFNNLERDQFCLRKILDWRENWLFFLFSLKNKIRIEHNFLISCGEILLEEGIKIR